MKRFALTAAALVGFASAASAQMDMTNPTVMTRSAPAEVVMGPNDDGIERGRFVDVTVGAPVEVSLDPQTYPRLAAVSIEDSITKYVFDEGETVSDYDLIGR